MQEIVENGHEIVEYRDVQASLRLPQRVLSRLARMQARADGTAEAAQAAVNTHNQRLSIYREAFEDACADAGIQIPQGNHEAQIDWTTGDVRFVPK